MRFIVRQPDCCTTSFLFEDPTIFNNNGLLCRFSLCRSDNEPLASEILVCNNNVGTQGVVGGSGEVEVDGGDDCKFEIDNQAAKYKVMIFAKSKKQTF